ncbi:hypothetical protein [Leuconostoc gelidum]|nr:hypothetical protein [Leuconostoc gelidum]
MVRKAFDQGFISIIRLDAILLIIGGIVAAILIKTGGQSDIK